MSATEDLGCVGSAVVVHPGDRLLIGMRTVGVLTDEIVDVMRARLAERFPGVEVTFVEGVAALAVLREPT